MSGLAYKSPVTTAFLTNDTLTITENDGVSKISIKNISAVSGTVFGSAPFKNLIPAAVTLAQNEAVSILAGEARSLDNLLITAPAGCTLEILIS